MSLLPCQWMNSLPLLFLSKIPVRWHFGGLSVREWKNPVCLHARLGGVQQVQPASDRDGLRAVGSKEEMFRGCHGDRHLQVTDEPVLPRAAVVRLGHGDYLAMPMDTGYVSVVLEDEADIWFWMSCWPSTSGLNSGP